MDYMIAVGVSHEAGFCWTVTGRFSSLTWDRLWTGLSVSKESWRAWQEAGGRFLILPELPVISRLAYIDEGTTSLDPLLLKQDCERVLQTATDADVKNMMRDLHIAALAAVDAGGTVEIFPSAGESIGEQLSSNVGNSE